jgi:hypothetical protein
MTMTGLRPFLRIALLIIVILVILGFAAYLIFHLDATTARPQLSL